MNAHLALQARLHDLEESEKKLEVQKPVDGNEEAGELDEHEASAEAEVESEEHAVDEANSEKGKYGRSSDSGEVSECIGRNMGAIRVEEEPKGDLGRKSGDGGHTPGEVWMESPHFLWGP
jgi:hypothetical protein